MKQVCGTCDFGVDHKAGNSSIEVLCAFDNEWRLDRLEGYIKWKERTEGKNWGQREINWFVPVRREKIASLINQLQNQLI